MSLIIVLMVVSIGLATSYAVLRSQQVTFYLARNADRQNAARQAAVTGLTTALRAMHLSEVWNGVGHTLSGRLSSTETYTVSFTMGDTSLKPGHADYADLPLRVTLVSTGYAVDPAHPQAMATYPIRVVVRLVPRMLSDATTDWDGWNDTTAFTLCQWSADESDDDAASVEIPFQVEGKMRLQGALTLAEGYPGGQNARRRYLGDLNAMRSLGLGDHRTFTGAIHLAIENTWEEFRSLLTDPLGLAIVNTEPSQATVWEHPGHLQSYRLYPGGNEYTVPTLPGTLRDIELAPDPETNPLGIFYSPGHLRLEDNVTVQGSIITATNADIEVSGRNVRLSAAKIASPDAAAGTMRLPAAVVGEDFVVSGGSESEVEGLLAVREEVDVKAAPQASTTFLHRGRLLVGRLLVERRDEWDRGDSWWNNRYIEFLAIGGVAGDVPFPVWLQEVYGLDFTPRLRIAPPSDNVTYHWPAPGSPIYLPHPDDVGLRWEVLQWSEGR